MAMLNLSLKSTRHLGPLKHLRPWFQRRLLDTFWTQFVDSLNTVWPRIDRNWLTQHRDGLLESERSFRICRFRSLVVMIPSWGRKMLALLARRSHCCRHLCESLPCRLRRWLSIGPSRLWWSRFLKGNWKLSFGNWKVRNFSFGYQKVLS